MKTLTSYRGAMRKCWGSYMTGDLLVCAPAYRMACSVSGRIIVGVKGTDLGCVSDMFMLAMLCMA